MKVGAFPILCIGFALALMVWSFGYFHSWAPNLEYAEKLQQSAVAHETEAAKHDKAYKKYEEAVKIVQENEAKWQTIVAKKTPPLGGADGMDLNQSPLQLVNDVPRFRDAIQRAVNRQCRAGGVKQAIAPEIPDPNLDSRRVVADYFNYPALPYPVVMWNLGTVTVQGTFEQIAANARAWKDMPNYLAMSDGLQITGTAPNLTGTYNVVIIGYLRGKTIYPASSLDTGGGGNNSPGGRPGGNAPAPPVNQNANPGGQRGGSSVKPGPGRG